MTELKNIKSNVKPHEILLVVDSMTGQDAVNVATSFNEQLGIDGVILTKLDGDTRGGAAISVKKVTNRPIKFAATGEKLSDIEVFHPDRMAQRILGMGDVLSVIEKAEEAFDIEEAEKILNNGGTIGIFPEGTRNKTQNNLLEFRKGAVRIAKSTNTPILPFAIKGEYKLFRKSITLEFGNPIDVNKMEIEEGNEYLRNEVLKLYRK